ncbi:MAG: DUF512 domain-containing protein [Tissierellia bacterium]|nr:DUF512 domain-containing protein [Tissierellia bacterium]
MEIKITTDKNIIENIVPGSIAEELELEIGDEILSINNSTPIDIIDYKYLISDEFIEMNIKKTSGELISFEIEKDYDEDLGIEFTNPLIDEAKCCSNNCVFCFINQLPPNMRKTLYFKDDDSRLSFLQGNFITLTNMSEEEIERIIKYKISPINVSVHTTNPQLRKQMLRNQKAEKVFEILKRFDDAHLEINCQIVSVPGINDGEELKRTIMDLYSLKNSVHSVAIVPVGITKYRENLPELVPYDREKSIEIINQIHSYQEKFLKERGSRFVFLGDEFYVLAGIEIPGDEEYEDYPQIENGVGLIRNFDEEINFCLNDIEINNKSGKVILVTGTLAESFLISIRDKVKSKLPNMIMEVIPIKNDFFGHTITVAGLVTGSDIIKQIKNTEIKNIVIPECMLRQDTDYFLDDVKISDLERELEKNVYVAKVNGEDFIRVLFEEVK